MTYLASFVYVADISKFAVTPNIQYRNSQYLRLNFPNISHRVKLHVPKLFKLLQVCLSIYDVFVQF
jgi:hypothetical protein